ncbi:hypothetical protein MLD38_001354 [Melastoma candidum]|uniref:Uncharacterized protein n=1 Tax=Melastoma candidum TaxID=119954 RepID=A0ACB9SGA6_9MYRT|nr:hypothetical protein MLD38_001354 [Melastoma candidum]
MVSFRTSHFSGIKREEWPSQARLPQRFPPRKTLALSFDSSPRSPKTSVAIPVPGPILTKVHTTEIVAPSANGLPGGGSSRHFLRTPVTATNVDAPDQLLL